MRKTIIITSVAVSLLLVLTSIILNDIPSRDVAHRYAPMAEAFASGDWLYAFHPRIQPLQIVSGGIIAYLLPCTGFMALKIVSVLWFFAGMIIIWKLFREIYENKPWVAAAATAFYALFPYNIRMAAEGLRESSKTFILLLIAYGLVKIYKNTKDCIGYVWLGCGCSMALICRADMIMTGLFLLFVGLVLECRERKFPGLSMIPLIMTGITMILCSLLNYYVCGHAMPDYRFATIFAKIAKHPAGLVDILLITLILGSLIYACAVGVAQLLRKIHAGIFLAALVVMMVLSSIYTSISDRNGDIQDFVASIIDGFCHVVGFFCLLVIIYLVRSRKFTGREFLLCMVVLVNAFFNIVPIQLFHKELYVSDRYLYTAVPLLAGFFVIGIQLFYQYVRDKYGDTKAKYALFICCTGVSIVFIFAAMKPQLNTYTRKNDFNERKGVLALASAIQKDYHGEKYRTCKRTLKQYSSKKAPYVLFEKDEKITAAAYLSGGSYTPNERKPDYFVGNKLPSKLKPRAKKIAEINFGAYSKTLWRIKI